MTRFDDQLARIREPGFIAALDQSGGSTPKALRAYGVPDSDWNGDTEMFDRVHQMRTRIMTAKPFDERVCGAILFENTMDRSVEGLPTARYLWEQKRIVPFLKVDKGMEAEADGVQLMKPIPGLEATCEKARGHGVFGTKMRSVVHRADPSGIAANVAQQFAFGQRIISCGLVPIIEPEVNIHAPDKADAESLLLARIVEHLDGLGPDDRVMLKLTLPETDNLYAPCIAHPNVVRVVALSGGYPREEANARLSRQTGMIASFSRALAEGLSATQSDAEFAATLDRSIQSIYDASVAG
jgi:fructose-bisphosphate aldolase class I